MRTLALIPGRGGRDIASRPGKQSPAQIRGEGVGGDCSPPSPKCAGQAQASRISLAHKASRLPQRRRAPRAARTSAMPCAPRTPHPAPRRPQAAQGRAVTSPDRDPHHRVVVSSSAVAGRGSAAVAQRSGAIVFENVCGDVVIGACEDQIHCSVSGV